MTEMTKVLSIRLESDDKEYVSRHLNRENVEGIIKQLKRGEIAISRKGVEFLGAITKSESVYTDCENCPYINDLDMSKFDEVCDFKGIDRQKALDRCVQMLWR